MIRQDRRLIEQYMDGWRDGIRDIRGNPRLDPPWFFSDAYFDGYRDGAADERKRIIHRDKPAGN